MCCAMYPPRLSFAVYIGALRRQRQRVRRKTGIHWGGWQKLNLSDFLTSSHHDKMITARIECADELSVCQVKF